MNVDRSTHKGHHYAFSQRILGNRKLMICRHVHKPNRGIWKGKLILPVYITIKKDKHLKSVFHILKKLIQTTNYH